METRAPGRPRKPEGMARTCTVSVALTTSERAKVLAEAKAHGQSPSAWVRDLLVLVLGS